jgi:hypothetical protein
VGARLDLNFCVRLAGEMKETAGRLFVWGTYFLAAAVIVQFLLAGLGIFADSYFFFWHAVVNAPIILLLALVLVLIGWFGGVPVRLRWLMAAIIGLALLQSLLLLPTHMPSPGALRYISGLHVVNALFIFWVALQLLDRTRVWAAKPA